MNEQPFRSDQVSILYKHSIDVDIHRHQPRNKRKRILFYGVCSLIASDHRPSRTQLEVECDHELTCMVMLSLSCGDDEISTHDGLQAQSYAVTHLPWVPVQEKLTGKVRGLMLPQGEASMLIAERRMRR